MHQDILDIDVSAYIWKNNAQGLGLWAYIWQYNAPRHSQSTPGYLLIVGNTMHQDILKEYQGICKMF